MVVRLARGRRWLSRLKSCGLSQRRCGLSLPRRTRLRGADGTGSSPLIQAVRVALHGDALIDPGVTARLLASFSASSRAAVAVQPIEALTEREEGVLLAVARGRTNAEIGEELHISLSTVKFHVAGLMTKLGARNRVELAMWAYETKRVT